jgi:hypothetical protein
MFMHWGEPCREHSPLVSRSYVDVPNSFSNGSFLEFSPPREFYSRPGHVSLGTSFRMEMTLVKSLHRSFLKNPKSHLRPLTSQAVMRWKHEEVEEAVEQLEDVERLREEKEALEREMARLKEMGGAGEEATRVEELLQVERELQQASRQLQQQVQL